MAPKKKRPPGRPPVKLHARHFQTSVSLPLADAELLRRLARERGVSFSALVQQAVKEWLRSEGEA